MSSNVEITPMKHAASVQALFCQPKDGNFELCHLGCWHQLSGRPRTASKINGFEMMSIFAERVVAFGWKREVEHKQIHAFLVIFGNHLELWTLAGRSQNCAMHRPGSSCFPSQLQSLSLLGILRKPRSPQRCWAPQGHLPMAPTELAELFANQSPCFDSLVPQLG